MQFPKWRTCLFLGIAYTSRALLHALYLCPIRRNRVLFQSFRGKQYSCNPKYISQALRERMGDDVDIVWIFKHPERYAALKDEGIRVVGDRTWRYFYEALTAKVVCVNTYYKPTLPRRRGQYFIRTWHGGGAYKKVGKDLHLTGVERRFIDMQQEGADLYLSSSHRFTQEVIRDAFQYTGEVFEYGMPRNDPLLNPAKWPTARANVYAALGLPEGVHMVLYAPTYRDTSDRMSEFALNYEGVCAALAHRFGGVWRAVFRGHHVVSGRSTQAQTIDATDYPDMQELLMAADVLITDYSSSIWDMSLMGKPCFLYATDLSTYHTARDFYMDIHEWPFPLAEDNASLVERIEAFDADDYRAAVARHHEQLGNCETGHAAERVAERIADIIRGTNEK